VVSRGALFGTIPDIRGLSERGARTELRKAGFAVRRIRQAFSTEYELNMIHDIEPAPGTLFSRDSSVEIILSLGPKPTHAETPNLIGETESEARELLEKAGLNVGHLEYRSSSTMPSGMVISQSVAPGAKAPLKSSVNLVIAGK
jgi:serine/threonine-protein kinase